MISAELDYKTLDDFLILPVQRIPRYPLNFILYFGLYLLAFLLHFLKQYRYIMLLEAIYKYTPINHPDRDILRKASHQVIIIIIVFLFTFDFLINH